MLITTLNKKKIFNSRLIAISLKHVTKDEKKEIHRRLYHSGKLLNSFTPSARTYLGIKQRLTSAAHDKPVAKNPRLARSRASCLNPSLSFSRSSIWVTHRLVGGKLEELKSRNFARNVDVVRERERESHRW